MDGLIISYKDFFNHDKPDLDKIMATVPSWIAIAYSCHICSQLHFHTTDSDLQEKVLEGLIKRQPEIIQKKVWSKYEERKKNKPTLIFDTYTILQLLNKSIVNFNDTTSPDTTIKDELKIFTSILLINEKYNKMPPKNRGGDKLDLYASMAWPFQVFSTELRMKKDFRYEVYRGLLFSDFISDYPELVQAMKELYGLNKSELHNYPLEVLNFYATSGLDNDNQIFTSTFSMDLEEKVRMLKPWVLDLSSGLNEKYYPSDYRTLRSKPIIKLGKNKYVISNWNFILDKSYTGLLFDLISTDVVKKKHIDLQTLRGWIGETFSEQYVYHLLEATSPGMKLIQGKPEEEANHDFYLRKGNKIALIENKDQLFVKNPDYLSIRNELHSKLVDPKGVKQLINIIEKLKQNPYIIESSLEQDYNPTQLKFYPILIVSDSTFTLTGMEDYVQREFNQKLKSLGNLPFKVFPVIILDVHTLMNFHDILAMGKTDIFTLIDEFYQQKVVLKMRGNLPGAKAKTISSQFQGFVELMSSHGEIMEEDVEGSLLNKTIRRLRDIGISEV